MKGLQMLLGENKPFVIYLVKFLFTFCALYYGTIAFIGIASPGGWYWHFGDQYLDYVAGLRYLLLHAASALLLLAGYDIYLKDEYSIRLVNGLGVHVGYDCIGYGVIFFWVAFILANKVPVKQKIGWLVVGVVVIFFVNVVRIALMLIAVNKKWPAVLGFDNHTWFNIVAYTVIFFMIYLFDQTAKEQAAPKRINQ
jgi:exosortase/archaeosortase family protein